MFLQIIATEVLKEKYWAMAFCRRICTDTRTLISTMFSAVRQGGHRSMRWSTVSVKLRIRMDIAEEAKSPRTGIRGPARMRSRFSERKTRAGGDSWVKTSLMIYLGAANRLVPLRGSMTETCSQRPQVRGSWAPWGLYHREPSPCWAPRFRHSSGLKLFLVENPVIGYALLKWLLHLYIPIKPMKNCSLICYSLERWDKFRNVLVKFCFKQAFCCVFCLSNSWT